MMPNLTITRHAILRYRERVERVPFAEVEARLNTRAFRAAMKIGAPYVRLGGGQRAVIKDGTVITILPREHAVGSMTPARDHLYENGECDG